MERLAKDIGNFLGELKVAKTLATDNVVSVWSVNKSFLMQVRRPTVHKK
jgi:hypothetical protein